jgi:hypothetical protein
VCHDQERAVVAREGTTLEDDQAAIVSIREKCDIVFAGFETLRQLQRAARDAIEAVRQNPSDAAYAAAMSVVASVTAQWDTIRDLLRQHELIEERPTP